MASSVEVNIGEQIRFWGSLVGTAGLDEDINKKANEYVRKLTFAMEPFVDDYIQDATDMLEERNADKERAGKLITEPTEADMNNLKIIP